MNEKFIPIEGENYFCADVFYPSMANICTYQDNSNFHFRMKHNLLFKTKEEAVARSKQLLGFIDYEKIVKLLDAIEAEVLYRIHRNHPCLSQWHNHPEDVLRFKQKLLNESLHHLIIEDSKL